MSKRTIRNIDLKDKRVLLRADFNVPIEAGKIADDWRIKASLPTLRYLLDHGCRLTICSHLGRPKGKPNPNFSLKPVASHLGTLLGQELAFAEDCIGEEALNVSRSLKSGTILLLENTRFHPEEQANDPDFARKLSFFGELFVDDAFATAHRAHASNVGVARLLPSVAGLLMAKEIDALTTALNHFEKPMIAVFGGVKVSDKFEAIKRIGKIADKILLAGGIANTAFRVQGLKTGASFVDEKALSSMQELLKIFGDKIELPIDVVIQKQNGEVETIDPKQIPESAQIFDVGKQTIDCFLETLKSSRQVIWNGPLGYFEKQPFNQGTLAFVRGLARLEAKVYVGGGDTDHALAQVGVREKMTHVSTGGGAFLDFLAGKPLPALDVLPEQVGTTAEKPERRVA